MGRLQWSPLTEIIDMKDIAIIGAGGFGREVACIIRRINEVSPTWNLVGFYDDDPSLQGVSNQFGKVMGMVDSLNTIRKHMSVVIAIGSPMAISNVVARLSNPMLDYPNIIAPSVTFLDKDTVSLGKGNIIGTDCSISCNISIGNFSVINCMTQIGHDVTIGDCNVIMPSCNLSGGVVIGNNNFMGVKSIVLQYLSIGNNTRIGAASVVMRNTKDGLLYLGNPAKGIEV